MDIKEIDSAFYLEERMDFGLINNFSGTPIIIVPTRKIQNRMHKKKRINKKWLNDMDLLFPKH